MMRRTLVGIVVLVLATTPASAQFAVIDPANLAQAILIVQRTQRHLEELQAQYRTIVRMAQGLGRMDQYRTPPSALTRHDAGLRDKVNHHYWSTFGAAAAVGLISGLAQWIGTAGFSDGPGDRTVIIAGGADAASQASLQVMSRFLNRLPTVTIREGHRVKVYVTSDLALPAYPAAQATRF